MPLDPKTSPHKLLFITENIIIIVKSQEKFIYKIVFSARPNLVLTLTVPGATIQQHALVHLLLIEGETVKCSYEKSAEFLLAMHKYFNAFI